jgi:hypothetical protein
MPLHWDSCGEYGELDALACMSDTHNVRHSARLHVPRTALTTQGCSCTALLPALPHNLSGSAASQQQKEGYLESQQLSHGGQRSSITHSPAAGSLMLRHRRPPIQTLALASRGKLDAFALPTNPTSAAASCAAPNLARARGGGARCCAARSHAPLPPPLPPWAAPPLAELAEQAQSKRVECCSMPPCARLLNKHKQASEINQGWRGHKAAFCEPGAAPPADAPPGPRCSPAPDAARPQMQPLRRRTCLLG